LPLAAERFENTKEAVKVLWLAVHMIPSLWGSQWAIRS